MYSPRSHETLNTVDRRRLSVGIEGLDANFNRYLKNLASGVETDEIFKPLREQLLEQFNARNEAHLIRQVMSAKYGQLPLREEFSPILETKDQLTALQYLSVGASVKSMRKIKGTKQISADEVVAIVESVKQALGAQTDAQAVFRGYQESYLGSEDRNFIIRMEMKLSGELNDEDLG